MKLWILILLLILFGLFEFLASFSFNIKIKMINKSKFTHAAALGSFSTVLFMTLAMLAPLVANETGSWFIIAGAFMMAFGNVSALLLLRPFEKWISKRNESLKEKEE